MSDSNATVTVEPKTASQLMKEVHAEAAAPEKAAPGKPKAPKKPKGKPAKAGKKAEIAIPVPPSADGPTLDPLNLPGAYQEKVLRKNVCKDRRLQHRKEMQDLTEDGAAEQYAALMSEGVVFPSVKIVRDISEGKDKGTLWLYDGYQRMGAHEINKTVEVDADIIEGNFADALMLSLASNGDNSVLPRTKDDARRAVIALLENKPVLDAVLATCKGNGGVHKVFARVCQVSTGTVDNALKSKGWKPKGDTLVKYNPPATQKETSSPAAKPDASLNIGPVQQAAVLSPVEQRKIDNEAFERLKQKDAGELLAEAAKSIRRVAAIFSSFVVSESFGPVVEKELHAFGMPVDPEFHARKKKEGTEFAPYMEMLELWPFVTIGSQIVEGCKKKITERQAQIAAKVEADAKQAKEQADAAKAAQQPAQTSGS